MNEQEFGSAPIGKLFVRCTVPAMVGMGFSAIYSITDGIFVGHFIGQEALAAVNLVMPIIMIITALADMVATGSSVRISILLGRGDDKEANRVFTVCIGLIAAIATVFGLLGCLFARQVISLMGAEGMTADYAVEYLRVFALFMPLCCIYYSTDNYLRVCGQVNLSMTINIVCSLLNIVLDVLLIVVLEQGLWAAAVASCASMSIGAVWSLVPFVRRKLPLVFSKGWIGMRQMLAIVANGSSEFFVSIAGSLFAVVVNVVLLRPWHSLAISLLGTCAYPLLFLAVLVPLWGLDGVWLLHFVAGVFSAAAAILIVRRVRLQAPPSAPPVASFFQPTQSLDFIRPFLAMPKLKQVWLWSSGLTKTFNYRRKAHI